MRQTLNASGAVLGNTSYDPWGQVQSGSVPTFGFTGELQQGSSTPARHYRMCWLFHKSQRAEKYVHKIT